MLTIGGCRGMGRVVSMGLSACSKFACVCGSLGIVTCPRLVESENGRQCCLSSTGNTTTTERQSETGKEGERGVWGQRAVHQFQVYLNFVILFNAHQ